MMVVIFGSTVSLQNLDTNEKIEYKIVGKDEADLKHKLIFFKSPIGKGLIGKNKGDLVEITTPNGVKILKFLTLSTFRVYYFLNLIMRDFKIIV